jgi:hypothetical protein
MSIIENTAETAVATARGAAVLNHVKQNNVSYLLAVLIGHMLGLTERVFEYGSGMC